MNRIVTFDDGRITLIHGDSRFELEMMAIEGQRFDLTVFDPPYGVNYLGRGAIPLPHIANDGNAQDVAGWTVPAVEAVMKDGTAFYICTRYDVAPTWVDAMDKAGIKTNFNPIIWNKGNWSAGWVGDFRRQNETILRGNKGFCLPRPWKVGDLKHWQERMSFIQYDMAKMKPSDVESANVILGNLSFTDLEKVVKRDTCLWTFPVQHGKEASLHPTTKPPEIMERAIVNHSDPGDRVLDPFMGSAPVGVAAVRQGRCYTGIEIDPDYFALAVYNVAKAGGWDVDDDITQHVAGLVQAAKDRRKAVIDLNKQKGK